MEAAAEADAWTFWISVVAAVLAVAALVGVAITFWRSSASGASAGPSANGPDALRAQISRWMLSGSLIVLAILIALVIVAAMTMSDDDALGSVTQTVFTAVLPLIGTWVGTILAFYFSKENFEAASRAQERLLDRTLDRLRRIPAESIMLPFTKIKGVTKLTAQQGEGQVLVDELIHALKLPTVNRMIFVEESDVVKYVLHESVIYREKALASIEAAGAAAGAAPAPPRTLADVLARQLEDGTPVRVVATSFATLPLSASLADCQEAINRGDFCRDVFLTKTGRPEKPEGWITDQDVREKAKA